jgi:hypothetical protein
MSRDRSAPFTDPATLRATVTHAVAVALSHPRLHAGSYVAWPGGHGCIDLVVTSGAVPGMSGAALHPPVADGDTPMARITVWARDKSGWHPTETKAAVPLGDLIEIPPLGQGLHADRQALERLVALVATHDQVTTHLNMPAWSRPPGVAIKEVFERGRSSWPGEHLTSLTAVEWGLARVEAFLAVASAVEVDGYRRDVDLLPLNHPARGETLTANLSRFKG